MVSEALNRKRHAEGHKYDGINAKKGSICNMYVDPVTAIVAVVLAAFIPFFCAMPHHSLRLLCLKFLLRSLLGLQELAFDV